MPEVQLLDARPEHVPAALVVDFDLWNIPGAQDDDLAILVAVWSFPA